MLYFPEAKLFLPSDITNCVLWLDANDTSTLSIDVNSNVFEWRDKSGNNRNATQGTSTARPALSIFFNARNSLLFDGINDFLSIASSEFPSTFFTTEFTLAISALFDRVDGSSRVIFAKRTAGTNGVVLAQTSASATTFFDWGGSSTRYTMAGNPPPISSSFFIERNTSNRNALINGIAVSPVSAGTANPNTTSNLFISRTDGGTGFFSGYINEIIFYNKLLTTVEKEKLVGYLNWKWQGVDYLPNLHPYKTRIPRRYN